MITDNPENIDASIASYKHRTTVQVFGKLFSVDLNLVILIPFFSIENSYHEYISSAIFKQCSVKFEIIHQRLKLNFTNMNEGHIPIESEFNELNISDKVSNINHKNCYQPFYYKYWCKECVPSCIIEGWTSGNSEIDEFIKDTIYNAGYSGTYPLFLEWVAFDRFENVKQIGEGGFAKVYSAKWIDGQSNYEREMEVGKN